MKKLLCLMLALLCLAGCAAKEPDNILRAMYVPMGDGYVLISDDGEPFTMIFPDDLTDADGNPIAPEDLTAGNVLALHNPGDMAASYPGILYGVTKAEVIETGKPDDIERHREVIDALSGLAIPDEPADAETVNRAMYVPFGDGQYVMIDELGQVYTIRFPDSMTGPDGEPIAKDDLTAGCIVDIYGDGVMMESYPGQYPGVTRLEVVDKGDPADIEQYREIIDGLYAEPEPLTEPPAMHLEFAFEDTVVHTQASMSSYSWEVDNGDGTCSTVIACGPHILQWQNLREVMIAEPTGILLTFPETAPDELICTRWPASMYMSDDISAEGETVIMEHDENGAYLLNAEPEYIYLLSAQWPKGSAEYGFITAGIVINE